MIIFGVRNDEVRKVKTIILKLMIMLTKILKVQSKWLNVL